MSDIFISYSHKDSEFVQRFNNALVESNRLVWVDWQSIPRGEDWWREIQHGIENADDFICVVSEFWLISEICQKELEHAIRNNKRIFPVILQQIRDEVETRVKGTWMNQPWEKLAREQWDHIRRLNWIFFDIDEKFKTEFVALLHALDEDQPYIKTHTRYLIRALEWERSDYNPSILLRGDELDFAKNWLEDAQSTKKLPEPTTNQKTYINQGVTAEQKRKRQFRRTVITLTVVGIFAIAALISLTIFGSQAQNQAVAATTRLAAANERLTPLAAQIARGEDIIEAQRLTVLANDILADSSSDTRAAILLGIRSLKLTYTPQADSALLKALERSHSKGVLGDHTSLIVGVAYSPDGKTVLTGSQDGTARLWDANTGVHLRTFQGYSSDGTQFGVWDVAYSPDGKKIIIGTGASAALLYEVETGELLHTFSSPLLGQFTHVAYAPDGKTILVGGSGENAYLWDVNSGQIVRTFSGHTNDISSVEFSPDGETVLTSSYDNTARLWDIQTGETLHILTGHNETVTSAVFSPNGQTILTASDDNTLRLWDTNTGATLRTFHTEEVDNAIFSPDGMLIAASGSDNTVHLWDAETGKQLHTYYGHSGDIMKLAFSPDGQSLLTGSIDHTARIWDVSNPRRFVGHAGAVNEVAFSPDGKAILTGSSDNTAQLWDANTGQPLQTFIGHTDSLFNVAYSPDGNTVLTTSGTDEDTGGVRLWDIKTGQTIQTFNDFIGVFGIAYSPDAKTILTGGTSLKMWDASMVDTMQIFEGHSQLIWSVAYSPDGKTIVAGGNDNLAYVWDIETGERIQIFSGHLGEINQVVYSPNSTLVATASNDKTINLWNVSTGELVRTLVGHETGVNNAIFSPDGKTILSSDGDYKVLLWDVETGKILRTFDVIRGSGIAYSPDGKLIAIGSMDNMVQISDTDYRDTLLYACTQVFQDFTDQERAAYDIVDNEPTCRQFDDDSASTMPATLTPIPITLMPNFTPLPTSTLPATSTPIPVFTPLSAVATVLPLVTF